MEIGAEWEVFHPLVRGTQRWSRGRTRETVRPYMPGYLFVRFDDDDGWWPSIAHVVGMKDIMYSGPESPAPVPDEAVALLMDRCSVEYDERDEARLRPLHYVREAEADAALAVGRTVRWQPSWLDGPLDSRVTWVGGERLRVLMEMFGARREIELRRANVKLIG